MGCVEEGPLGFFKEPLSYDLIQNVGRRDQAKTSKIDIHEAMA